MFTDKLEDISFYLSFTAFLTVQNGSMSLSKSKPLPFIQITILIVKTVPTVT